MQRPECPGPLPEDARAPRTEPIAEPVTEPERELPGLQNDARDGVRDGTGRADEGTRARSLPRLDPAASPAAIEARSFAIIEAEAGTAPPFHGPAWAVARRLVHTMGDMSLLTSLHLPDAAVAAGVAALRAGRPVYTDTEMVRAGIPERRTRPLGVEVQCFLAVGEVAQEAVRRGATRARVGMEALGHRLGGSVLAIGNAPTAVLALLDLLEAGAPRPALVIAMPVGFVNAAESKELLLARGGLPVLSVLGRRGGSPLAAATVNALCELALGGR